jgi:hypothetical protein
MQKKQTQADVGDELRHYFHILAPTICNNKRQVNSNFVATKIGFFGQNILSASYFGLGSQENLRIH